MRGFLPLIFTLSMLVPNYKPNQEAVKKIAEVKDHYRIVVVFGYWCKDSRLHVPEFLKVMWEAENPNISYDLIPIPRGRKLPVREKYNIQRIPTFIIYRDGKEVGRIIEHPRKTIEEDLADILTHPGS